MREKRYLFKNIGLLTISQFGTKILSFLLVPLYTYVLSTTEYGLYDFYSTTVSLLIPILTLNIADPLLRFPLDKERNVNEIAAIGMKYFIRSLLFVIMLLLFNMVLKIDNTFNKFPYLLLLMFLVNSLNGLLINLARGLEKIKEIAISGVICSIFMIVSNLLFLLVFKLGLKGYFYANIIGLAIQNIYIFMSTSMYRIFLGHTKINKDLEKEMVAYSKPLLINNISWWISSVSDRYIVTWICGIAANGVYSVANKIPSILNIFQTIFGQAWTLSAVQEFDPEDKKCFFTDMYNSYNFCMIIVCSFLIATTKIFAEILYAKEFYYAWRYVPFLLIAIVFGALSGYIGGIFATVKDTKAFARTSIFGAIVNLVLNVFLINYIGTIGAAISTAICYVVVWALRIVNVKKYIKLKINLQRDIFAYTILVVQSLILLFLKDIFILYIFEIMLIGLLMLIYSFEIKKIINSLKGKYKNV